MSDVPGAALVLACICVERWASRRPSLAREIALGALIAVAVYVRTVSALLIPAILLARFFEMISARRVSWLRALPFVAATLALVVPWNIRCARLAPTELIDQNFVHSYASGMWHEDPRDPNSPTLPVSAVLERIPVRGEQLLALLGNRLRTKNMLLDREDGGAVANDVVETRTADVALGGVVMVAATWLLIRKRRASEWLLFANCALVSIYFGFQHRLVLLPFVLGAPLAVEFVLDLGDRLRRLRTARFACAGALLAVIAVDFRPREGWENIAARDRLFREFCADVERNLRPDARIAASVGWHYSLFLDRPVYSLLFAKQPAQFVYDKYRLNTLICAPFTPSEMALLPECRALPHCENVAHGGVVVRVRE